MLFWGANSKMANSYFFIELGRHWYVLAIIDRLLTIEFSVCYYFAPRRDKKDSRLSIFSIAHGTDDLVGVLGILPGPDPTNQQTEPLLDSYLFTPHLQNLISLLYN